MEIRYSSEGYSVWPTPKIKLPGLYTSKLAAQKAATAYKLRENLVKEKRKEAKKG